MDEWKPLIGGRVRGGVRDAVLERGRAVQVDAIKPKLKAPEIKLLKLKYDKPLSKIAFKFNLRRLKESFRDHPGGRDRRNGRACQISLATS